MSLSDPTPDGRRKAGSHPVSVRGVAPLSILVSLGAVAPI